MIYVIQTGDSRSIKIGYTGRDDVAKRIAQLQTGNPKQIGLVMTVAGSLLEEQLLHDALRQAFLRARLPPVMNEWYPGRHPFMRRVVEELKYGPRYAIAFAESYWAGRVGLQEGDRVVPMAERLRKEREKNPWAGRTDPSKRSPAWRRAHGVE